MPLNTEQQAAVSYLKGPLLVLAGPGTGKTQLLSAKVAYILENTDANPNNILCLTFTESGAANMRERLKSIIGYAADEVNIYTYHAFGAEVLSRYQNYAEIPERRLDQAIDEITQQKIIREIQSNLPVRDILKNTAPKDIVDTIQHAKSARLTAKDLAKIAQTNLEDSEKISEFASDCFARLIPREKFQTALDEVYQPLLGYLIKLTSTTPITGKIEPIANLLARELSEIINHESASEKPKLSPLTSWRTNRFERTELCNYRLKDYIANKKLVSLANIMQAYDIKLHESGLYDFADMIEEAISALKNDRGFRLTLSEQFQYILLDEFQDTNPSQFELIKLITDYEAPQIMAVGDDDQAIFEFQGASASNLLDYQDYYHAKIITLLDNYRSTGPILDFSHQIADQLTDSFAKKHHINKTLRSMQDLWRNEAENIAQNSSATDQYPVLSRHEFMTARDEYYWVAHEIKKLLKAGVPGDEIAIIAPKHKYIAPILPYLKDQNIALSYEKRSNLLDDPKIHSLIVLSRFIYELSEERIPTHLLLEILTFPFFNIKPIDALNALSNARFEHKAPLTYLSESGQPELAHLADWFANLVAISYDIPFELFLGYLIGLKPLENFTSPYLEYYATHTSKVEQFELYQNLAALKQTVTNHLRTPRPTLADFIATIDDYEEAEAPIMHTSPYEEGESAVQVMSAHKSKGLEFRYVFLVALDDLAWGKAKGNNNLFSLPKNLASIRHTGATDDERLRLLFVAITRAKEHLIMTGSVEDFAGKTPARLSYLGEIRDPKSTESLSPFLPEQHRRITIHTDPDIDSRLEALEESWTSIYRVADPDLRELFQKRIQNYRLTATDLTSFIDIIYAGPESIYRSRLLGVPEEPLTLQIAYGNLIHLVFEHLTKQGISDDEAVALFCSEAKKQPLSRHEVDELIERGKNDLPISLAAFSQILRSPHAKAEVNFPGERLTIDNIPIMGKIDHLEIDPKNKTIEVYDFKTGKYQTSRWQSHPTLYKYSLQLGFYKLLLNASREYHDYQVTKGHILFVTPDEANHAVHDRVYEFEPATEAELIALMHAVYQEISSLDFIDNPAINLPADKSHTLTDIKKFIKTLIQFTENTSPID